MLRDVFHDRARPRSSLHSLEPLETSIDASPAGADQVDEKRKIVDAGVAFGEQFALDSLEPPDRLVEQPSDLGDVSPDR